MQEKLIFTRDSKDKIKTNSFEPIKQKSEILNYFSSVPVNAYSASMVFDPITNKSTDISNNLFRDGEYVWTSLTVYLFEKYNLKLNDDFIEYVLNKTKPL